MSEGNVYFKHTESGPNNIDKPFKTCGRKEVQETIKVDKKVKNTITLFPIDPQIGMKNSSYTL